MRRRRLRGQRAERISWLEIEQTELGIREVAYRFVLSGCVQESEGLVSPDTFGNDFRAHLRSVSCDSQPLKRISKVGFSV